MKRVAPPAEETADERTIRLLNEEIARLRQSVDAGIAREHGLEATIMAAERATLAADARADERGQLLDEVNHRVKNSIQMAVSLLSLQMHASDEPTVRNALASAIQRLSHIAKVHSMLYGHSPNKRSISFGAYLTSLCEGLNSAVGKEQIRVVVDADELVLDTQRAVNLALIAGEAITNAIKYAFPNGQSGTVKVECRRLNSHVVLAISDDGIGIPEERRKGALGLRLIRTLGKAIDATPTIENIGGTRVSVSFPA